jgi:hypothetical protein
LRHRRRARGHGVEMHFKLYELRQHEGRMDEREIFDEMGLELDARDYQPVLDILHHFSIESVELMTNNPERMEILGESDITVADRIPLETEINEYNEKLLLQEKEWLGYETSYKTHDEWVERFDEKSDGSEYGYMVTYDHADLTDTDFGQQRPDEEPLLDQLDDDAFTTLYVNFAPPESLVQAADKVIEVEGEEWSEVSKTQREVAL